MRSRRNSRHFKISRGFGENYKKRRLQAWNDLAHSWPQYTQGDSFHQRTHERLCETVLAAKPTGLASLIDLGCGPGRFLQMIRSQARWKRIVGIDFCHKMLNEAKNMEESCVSDPLQIDYKYADLELPIDHTAIFKYRDFDVATAIFLIDEVQDTGASFASAASVLRMDGHLICAMLDVHRELERHNLKLSDDALVMSKNLTVGGEQMPGELFRVLRSPDQIIESAEEAGLKLRINEVVSPKALSSRNDGPALRIMVLQKML